MHDYYFAFIRPKRLGYPLQHSKANAWIWVTRNVSHLPALNFQVWDSQRSEHVRAGLDMRMLVAWTVVIWVQYHNQNICDSYHDAAYDDTPQDSSRH